MMTTAVTAATATTTTTTTVVSVVTMNQAISLGVFATALLIGLLVLKELLSAYASEPRARSTWKGRLARFYAAHLNVAILPLMFIFGLIVVTKIASVL
jgi:hypothetical protein